MAQATSQQVGSSSANLRSPDLSNIDYSRMCEQLRSMQNDGKVPAEYQETLNEAIAVLSNGEMEMVFTEVIQSRSRPRLQTMAASSGQGASSSVSTGRGGGMGFNPNNRRTDK